MLFSQIRKQLRIQQFADFLVDLVKKWEHQTHTNITILLRFKNNVESKVK